MRTIEHPVYCQYCAGEGVVRSESVGYGHACGGDDALCARVCPVPVQEENTQPCEWCGGYGYVDGDSQEVR